MNLEIHNTTLLIAATLIDSEILVLLPIAIIGLLLLVFAALLYLREASGTKNLHSSASSVSLPKLKFDSANDQQAPRSKTDSKISLSPSTAETKKLNIKKSQIYNDEDTAAPFDYLSVLRDHESNNRWNEAAAGYKSLGLLAEEIRVLEQLEPTRRLLSLYKSVGNKPKALECLSQMVQNAPTDWLLRAKWIGSLLDAKQQEKALQIYETALEERVSLGIVYDFFVLVGVFFENNDLPEYALNCYKNAVTAEETNTALHTRMNYLRHLIRLQKIDESASQKLRTSDVYRMAKKNLFSDSGINDSELDLDIDEVNELIPEKSEEVSVNVQRNKVLVGHPAFGKSIVSAQLSALVISNPITRMEFESTLSERDSTVLFQCRDKLIDFPVTLRVQRLFLEENQVDLLVLRLKKINSFFHPNITKLIYCDCVDHVIRVETEYHQGGSFYAMIKQLKQIGLPLGLRLLLQVASGLVYSHKNGVIHGDLRAENIMIGHDQLIKIVDFSLQPWPLRNTTSANPLPLEEVKVDLQQYADLIEFTLGFCNVTSFDDDVEDPKAKVYKLVESIRTNKYDSIAGIQHELIKLLDDVIPHG